LLNIQVKNLLIQKLIRKNWGKFSREKSFEKIAIVFPSIRILSCFILNEKNYAIGKFATDFHARKIWNYQSHFYFLDRIAKCLIFFLVVKIDFFDIFEWEFSGFSFWLFFVVFWDVICGWNFLWYLWIFSGKHSNKIFKYLIKNLPTIK
jgi:hypothetical protein